MPLYEYKCQDCGEVIERIQKFSDPILTECPNCENGVLKRVISAPAFQFKGTGWYVTDYAKSGSNGKSDKGSSGESSSDSSSDSKPDSKSESKPESKSESKSETKSETKPAAKSSD